MSFAAGRQHNKHQGRRHRGKEQARGFAFPIIYVSAFDTLLKNPLRRKEGKCSAAFAHSCIFRRTTRTVRLGGAEGHGKIAEVACAGSILVRAVRSCRIGCLCRGCGECRVAGGDR